MPAMKKLQLCNRCPVAGVARSYDLIVLNLGSGYK
jgi:hypothetical protein